MDPSTFGVFLAAAFVLAVVPGPGMLYVLARTLRGGRREGLMSTLGTAVAGTMHTLAAALGISAVLATSALAFTVVKWAGVVYLIYLGVRSLLERGEAVGGQVAHDGVSRGALRQGVLTEVLNPKTALFFLAFIPQFIDTTGNAFAQFVVLGLITTLLLLPMMLAFLVLMIFTSFRSQKKEQKRKQELINSLRKHDKVQTHAGIIGTVGASVVRVRLLGHGGSSRSPAATARP